MWCSNRTTVCAYSGHSKQVRFEVCFHVLESLVFSRATDMCLKRLGDLHRTTSIGLNIVNCFTIVVKKYDKWAPENSNSMSALCSWPQLFYSICPSSALLSRLWCLPLHNAVRQNLVVRSRQEVVNIACLFPSSPVPLISVWPQSLSFPYKQPTLPSVLAKNNKFLGAKNSWSDTYEFQMKSAPRSKIMRPFAFMPVLQDKPFFMVVRKPISYIHAYVH